MSRSRRQRRGRGVAMASGALLAVVAVSAAASGVAAAQGAPGHRSGWRGHGWYGLEGTVAATPAPSATSFTVDAPGCSTPVTVGVNPSTVFFVPGAGTPPGAVTPGERVVVSFDPDASTPTARTVTILLAEVSGTVQSTGGGSVTLIDAQGFTRTVEVSGAKVVAPAGTTSTIGAGERVDAFGDVAADHTTLDAVVVYLRPAPGASTTAAARRPLRVLNGTVVPTPAPSAAGFTVVLPGGGTEAVAATSSTRYDESGAPPPTGVAPGERVTVWLASGVTSPTATAVVIHPSELQGIVQSVSSSSSSFVLSDQQGFWWTVNVGTTTTVQPSTVTLSSLTGDEVTALGLVDPDGLSLDAQLVKVHTPPPSPSAGQQIWDSAHSTCPSATPGGPAPLTATTTAPRGPDGPDARPTTPGGAADPPGTAGLSHDSDPADGSGGRTGSGVAGPWPGAGSPRVPASTGPVGRPGTPAGPGPGSAPRGGGGPGADGAAGGRGSGEPGGGRGSGFGGVPGH